MSDMDQKRDHVNGMYPGKGWKAKVAKMSDAQVMAIYMREVNKAKDKPKPKKESAPDDPPF